MNCSFDRNIKVPSIMSQVLGLNEIDSYNSWKNPSGFRMGGKS